MAIARRFAEAGASVLLTSRKPDALAEAAALNAGRAGRPGLLVRRPCRATLQQAAACRRHGGRALRLDRRPLVNNAATSPYYGPLLTLDPPHGPWRSTVEVNQGRAAVVDPGGGGGDG